MNSYAVFHMTALRVLPILTDKQAGVLAYLNQYFLLHRVYPTTREIAARFGVTQTAAVTTLGALHKKGYVAKRPGERRNVRLTDLALEKLHLMGEGISPQGTATADRQDRTAESTTPPVLVIPKASN